MKHLPPADLYDRVINRINYEHRRGILKRSLLLYFSGFLLSLGTFSQLIVKSYEAIVRAGLPEIFSLVFTNFNLVMSNISDFTMLILESLPSLFLALSFSILMILIFSFGKLFGSLMELKTLNKLKAN